MDIKDFSDEAFAAYLAALLDGEGSIEIHPKECGIRIRIANTFRPVLVGIHDRLGYGRVEAYPKRPTRPLFAYSVSNAHDCRELLLLCRPFIQIKAARADRALAILAAMQERQEVAKARDDEIMASLARGETQTSIGRRVGVSQAYVSYLKKRRKTQGVDGRLNPRRSIKKGSPPSAALFTNQGHPLSDPCRPPFESADLST